MKSRSIKADLQQGFTLIEIAIVLLIVGVLLGYTVAMFPIQRELKQYRQVEVEMDEITQHLIGFAQVNGRLPCPDTDGNINGAGAGTLDGLEDPDDIIDNVTSVLGIDNIIDDCKSFSGFIPAGTLGINGDINPTGQLLDPWGQPYRYHVSDINANSDAVATTAAAIDLVSPNGIREEGLSFVVPDLSVCDDSDNSSATDPNCAAVAATDIVIDAAAVIISSGIDRGLVASNIQDENRDDFHDGTNDRVYTSSTRSDAAGAEYDDVLRWISPNVLYSEMIKAGQLP